MILDVMIMSGVEDGLTLSFNTDNDDGKIKGDEWQITIGRSEDSDICLRNDTYISRHHAVLHGRAEGWWLEDCESKNGTFIEDSDEDLRVSTLIPLQDGQLFRIGRTWLRLQPNE